MRIVAGNWRRRLLPIAAVAGLRPTPERVRETLFNWLAADIHGARCLDLFAGTGILGLEALSRGARGAVLVEKSGTAARTIAESIRMLEVDDADLRKTDALQFLRHYDGEPFDIVFLDPPFADAMLEDLCRLLAGSDMLAAGARVYVELERRQAFPALPDGWRVDRQGTAGRVRFALLST